ncbi:hypothetical protein ISCGN_014115 [Ixodes scapularis]
MVVAANTVVVCNAAESTEDPTLDPELAEREKGFRQLTEDITRFATKQFYPIISELIYDPRLSSKCAGGLLKIGTAMRDGELWALQMIDSIGRPPSGILTGRLADYGAYDQCLDIRHPKSSFQGRYCMLQLVSNGKISPTLYKVIDKVFERHNFKYVGNISRLFASKEAFGGAMFQIGACIPSLCQQEDLQFILDTVLGKYKIQLNVGWCRVNVPVVLDQRQVAIISIYGAWIFLLLLGTAFDLLQCWRSVHDREDAIKPRRQGIPCRVLLAFSLRRSILKLMQMPQFGDYSKELGFVHGMRVLSATWIILGHSYILRDMQYNSDLTVVSRRMANDIFFSCQLNSFLGVVSFFAITGFLSGYILVKTPTPKVATYLLVLVPLIRRYIRLVPSMMALLGFVYLIPLVATGPLLNDMWFLKEQPCDVHWWRIPTMTHNYMTDLSNMCLPHFWYVSADFQLAIVTTVILVVIVSRFPKLGIAIMVAIVFSTSLALGLVTHFYNYMPLSLVISTDIRSVIDTNIYIYGKAFTYASGLFTAIIFGYLAAKPHRLSIKAQAFWWTVAVVFACSSLFGAYSWNRGREPQRLESDVYAALHRFAWGFAVSWVMYACATGRGGPVNKILSNPIFYPLGRLSFAVYLVHVFVFGVNAILRRERRSHQPFLEGQEHIGVTITAYALATIPYLCIECPIAVLDNLVFGWAKEGEPQASAETTKQNKAHEMEGFQCAAASKSSQPHGVHRTNSKDKSPTRGANHGDGPYDGEYKSTNAHENGAHESDIDVKTTNNVESSVVVRF